MNPRSVRTSVLTLLALIVALVIVPAPALAEKPPMKSSMSDGNAPVSKEHASSPGGESGHTVARIWNEMLLDAIRIDIPKPPTHSRNLLHLSAAMWDAWATYDPLAAISDFLMAMPEKRLPIISNY